MVRFRACLLRDLAWAGVFKARPERFGLLILLGACLLRYRLFFVLLMMLVIYHNKLHYEDVFNKFFLVLFHFHHNKSKAECQLLNRMGWGLPIPCFQKNPASQWENIHHMILLSGT